MIVSEVGHQRSARFVPKKFTNSQGGRFTRHISIYSCCYRTFERNLENHLWSFKQPINQLVDFWSMLQFKVFKRINFEYNTFRILLMFDRRCCDSAALKPVKYEYVMSVILVIQTTRECVLNTPASNTPALVQIMAWLRTGDMPLSELMMT